MDMRRQCGDNIQIIKEVTTIAEWLIPIVSSIAFSLAMEINPDFNILDSK